MSTSPLLDQVRAVARLKQFSLRTEESYVQAIKRFIMFHDKRHPATMGANEIQAYLTHLAVEGNVAASTLNVARCAIQFLYREVLRIELPALDAIPRAQRPARVPVVFTRAEVHAVLNQLEGTYQLMAQLLYGSGLRLMECVRLRAKDLDFAYHQLTVRDGKGEKDRLTILPARLVVPLQAQLRAARHLHAADVALGYGTVYLPHALARKYPNAATDWRWQYVFSASQRSKDPRSGAIRRHHIAEDGLQRAVKAAIDRAGVTKAASCHTFRHSFATHLLEDYVELHKVSRSSFSSANHRSWMPVWGRFSFAKETCPHTPAKERHAAGAGAQAPTPSPAPPSPPSPLLSLLLSRPSACRCITGVAPS
jgi:integron integrase